MEPARTNDPLGDPALHRSLEDFVRRRVPSSDVGDVVQTILCDALAAAGRPSEADELKRWLLGIARHKVADYHRRAHREPSAELHDIAAGPPPLEARSLAEWAEKQVGETRDAQQTLDWMAREGEGEKLEAIAAEEQVPAARVRQRVSRMRRWMKERWVAELAAVAVLGVVALVAYWILSRPKAPEAQPVQPEPSSTALPEVLDPLRQARALREDALKQCERGAWRPCLDGLDRARALDPEGDKAEAIGAARAKALEALELQKAPQMKSVPNDEPQKSAPAPKSAPKSAPAPKSTQKPTQPEEPTQTQKQAPMQLKEAEKAPAKSRKPKSDLGKKGGEIFLDDQGPGKK